VTLSNTIKVDWFLDGVLQSILSESLRWNLTVNGVPTPTPTPTPIPTPTPAPILLLEENSSRGVALDSVTWLREPFSVFSTRNFSADGRTRIVLFAMNVEINKVLVSIRPPP